MRITEITDLPMLDQILISVGAQQTTFQRLVEGQWISGRFANGIRVDQATHGAGQKHAHVYGRKGTEIGVVNVDGSASHGSRCCLHPKDAAALKARGFNIKPGNIVEWILLPTQPRLLLEG